MKQAWWLSDWEAISSLISDLKDASLTMRNHNFGGKFSMHARISLSLRSSLKQLSERSY